MSIWASQHPYADIPDEYFEETYFKNNTLATNQWSKNFNLVNFVCENMETNGAQVGAVKIINAAAECSFSNSYVKVLLGKAKKKKMENITWIILLFNHEYSVKVSGVDKDNYVTFLGAFDYDETADNYQP